VKSRVTISCLLAACALVACSGDDDTADPTTTATSALATTIAEAPTVATPTTATAPSSTAVATTTSVPTTAPIPTTAAAPTSTGPLDEAEAIAAIIEAAQGAWRTGVDVLLDPWSDERLAALAEFRTASQAAAVAEVVHQMRSDNRMAVENPEMPVRIAVDPMSVVIDLEDGLGTVDACQVDSLVEIQVAGNPDGTDRVLDDDVVHRIVRYELALEADRWLVSAASEVSEVPACA
jgi:hypothetical protein